MSELNLTFLISFHHLRGFLYLFWATALPLSMAYLSWRFCSKVFKALYYVEGWWYRGLAPGDSWIFLRTQGPLSTSSLISGMTYTGCRISPRNFYCKFLTSGWVGAQKYGCIRMSPPTSCHVRRSAATFGDTVRLSLLSWSMRENSGGRVMALCPSCPFPFDPKDFLGTLQQFQGCLEFRQCNYARILEQSCKGKKRLGRKEWGEAGGVQRKLLVPFPTTVHPIWYQWPSITQATASGLS